MGLIVVPLHPKGWSFPTIEYYELEMLEKCFEMICNDVPCFIYTNKNDFDKQRNSVDINELYRAYGRIFN